MEPGELYLFDWPWLFGPPLKPHLFLALAKPFPFEVPVIATFSPFFRPIPFSTAFAITATDNYTLVDPDDIPSHVHSGPSHSHGAGTLTYSVTSSGSGADTRATGSNAAETAARSVAGSTAAGGTGNTGVRGSDGAHAHAIDLQLEYVDIIGCRKN